MIDDIKVGIREFRNDLSQYIDGLGDSYSGIILTRDGHEVALMVKWERTSEKLMYKRRLQADKLAKGIK